MKNGQAICGRPGEYHCQIQHSVSIVAFETAHDLAKRANGVRGWLGRSGRDREDMLLDASKDPISVRPAAEELGELLDRRPIPDYFNRRHALRAKNALLPRAGENLHRGLAALGRRAHRR
jgi:hypothetical protein